MKLNDCQNERPALVVHVGPACPAHGPQALTFLGVWRYCSLCSWRRVWALADTAPTWGVQLVGLPPSAVQIDVAAWIADRAAAMDAPAEEFARWTYGPFFNPL